MERITTTEITKKLKIPFGRLREWIVKDYIKPSFPSPGQGQAAEFNILDVYKIKAFQHMIDGGLTRGTAAIYIEAIENSFQKDWMCEMIIFERKGKQLSADLIIVSKSVKSAKGYRGPLHTGDPGLFPDLSENWDDLYVLNFQKIRESVDKAFR